MNLRKNLDTTLSGTPSLKQKCLSRKSNLPTSMWKKGVYDENRNGKRLCWYETQARNQCLPRE